MTIRSNRNTGSTIKAKVKLFGGVKCTNVRMPFNGLKAVDLEVQRGTTLNEIYSLLDLCPSKNLVGMVDGHSQSYDFKVENDCNISIFRPMSDKQHDLLRKIKV